MRLSCLARPAPRALQTAYAQLEVLRRVLDEMSVEYERLGTGDLVRMVEAVGTLDEAYKAFYQRFRHYVGRVEERMYKAEELHAI